MLTTYKHTQIGYVTLGSLSVTVLLLAGLMTVLPHPWTMLPVLVVLIVCAVLFATLTTEVNTMRLRLHFGPGLIHKTVQLRDIARCETVRIPWYAGWGIHSTHRGWVYNVSGWHAVEITLHNGHTLLVGTDDPEGLCQAIRLGSAGG